MGNRRRRTSAFGFGNTVAGRDVVLKLFLNNPAEMFDAFFEGADRRFKDEVSASGKVFRISSSVDYSSKALTTSLIASGLPLDTAVQVPLHILDTLKDIADEKGPDEELSTADIRAAVVRCLDLLQDNGRFTAATVETWRAAYIRRYGNPDNQFIQVIDRGTAHDLTFAYIQKELLPHLLCRVFGLPREKNPLQMYSEVLAMTRVDEMSREILRIVNTLPLYSISYQALLHLTQDIILEPPHPWMVSEDTISRVTDYNMERMRAHRERLENRDRSGNPVFMAHAYQEYFRHAAAAILSRYGAFLGVGPRYGVTELVRILTLRGSNVALWSFCRLAALDEDLHRCGTTLDALLQTARRVQGIFNTPASNGQHLLHLNPAVAYFDRLVNALQ